jgi:6-pyruvoyltetrahydropterin/6-carboxytetrahydropterin synthase
VISVSRRYEFAAAHVLRQPCLSDAENERIYGKCANANGHGHNYGLEVTITGPVDPDTGRIIEPERLDEIVRDCVLERFDHRMLNEDPLFQSVVPTAENIATAVHGRLEGSLTARAGVRLLRVRIVETQRNHFDLGEMA